MTTNTIDYEKQISSAKYLPFNIQWLDSSYQQTCLPDSPWHKVISILIGGYSL